MKILAIESSCDETAVAVVEDGRQVICEKVASQIDIHREYGGVVPEIASRQHVETISELIDSTLEKGGLSFSDIDVVAATRGPGLVGALLVGLTAGKTLAYALDLPFVGANHMQGHICANYLAHPELEPPFLGLVVSGGHTYLLHVKDYTNYDILGQTLDDAAGEVFDKIARALGLPYPGGPHIDALAKTGDPKAMELPRVMLGKGSYDFSFSGLKTAVLNGLNQAAQKGQKIDTEDVAASFQQAVLDVLIEKTISAAKELNLDTIAMSGGVSANEGLRLQLGERAKKEGLRLFYPPRALCTDNAAMIGSAAYYQYLYDKENLSDIGVDPNLGL
ncbi:MAG: tRNA (adenosine(37)-N6)-threonylcarbamoyltransferase complex transferase subunit TsaD [Tissierellia bacterium]|nr:tRNA (adenosine(37)-N6)-threonylcarbamoyltransferase complex transferase subunit TsaD [Tissierellia bacterium]